MVDGTVLFGNGNALSREFDCYCIKNWQASSTCARQDHFDICAHARYYARDRITSVEQGNGRYMRSQEWIDYYVDNVVQSERIACKDYCC